MPLTKSSAPFLAAFGFASIFGFSFIFSRNALHWVSPLHLLGFRFLVATLFMHGLRLSGKLSLNISKGNIAPLLLLGLFQPILYFLGETIGIRLTSASEAGMVIAIIPILTLLAARAFLNEKPSPPQVIAIILSVSGVLVIGLMQASSGLGSNVWGLLILLGAPLAAAIYSVLSRYLSPRYSPVEMTYVMMHVGLIFFLPASIGESLLRGEFANFLTPLTNIAVTSAVLYLGILSSGVAFFLMNYALSQLTAAQVSAFPSLTTLIAVSASVIFLGETLYWYHLTGGLMIISGVWGANYYQAREGKRAAKLLNVPS